MNRVYRFSNRREIKYAMIRLQLTLMNYRVPYNY